MVAGEVAHLDRLDARLDAALAHREPVGRVVEKRVAAPLRFEHQREGRVAGDLELGDVVRLDRDVERHSGLSLARFALAARGDKRNHKTLLKPGRKASGRWCGSRHGCTSTMS